MNRTEEYTEEEEEENINNANSFQIRFRFSAAICCSAAVSVVLVVIWHRVSMSDNIIAKHTRKRIHSTCLQPASPSSFSHERNK